MISIKHTVRRILRRMFGCHSQKEELILHSQVTVLSTAVPHRHEDIYMSLPLRAAMSSDKLLLCNSQKEQRKTNMANGNKTLVLLPLPGALPSRLLNTDMKWTLSS